MTSRASCFTSGVTLRLSNFMVTMAQNPNNIPINETISDQRSLCKAGILTSKKRMQTICIPTRIADLYFASIFILKNLFLKYKKYGQYQTNETNYVIPLQAFALKNNQCKNSKNR